MPMLTPNEILRKLANGDISTPEANAMLRTIRVLKRLEQKAV